MLSDILDNLGISLSVPFKDTEDCGFALNTSYSFAFHLLCAEVTFIDLDNANHKSLIIASLSNLLA